MTLGPPAKGVRMAMSDDDAAEGLLNTIEMAFRAYDPCFGCATHALPEHTPLKVRLHGSGHLRKSVHA